MQKKKRKQYTAELKTKIVKEMLKEEKTIGKLAAKFQIPGKLNMKIRVDKEETVCFVPNVVNPLILKHYEHEWDELYCVKGDMGLSQVMRQKFEERYGQHPMQQSPNPLFHKPFHGGLHWFCPGDGEALNTQLECPQCGIHLRDLVYPLIELHPDKKD